MYHDFSANRGVKSPIAAYKKGWVGKDKGVGGRRIEGGNRKTANILRRALTDNHIITFCGPVILTPRFDPSFVIDVALCCTAARLRNATFKRPPFALLPSGWRFS